MHTCTHQRRQCQRQQRGLWVAVAAARMCACVHVCMRLRMRATCRCANRLVLEPARLGQPRNQRW